VSHTPPLVLAVVAALMLYETRLSRRHERALRAAGAVEPEGDPYRAMQWAYPGAFVAMGIESAIRGGAGARLFIAGGVVFVLAKALKYWAVASLGPSWSFRVLIVRDTKLVDTGPYRLMRHPNYVAVLGELVGCAALLGAPIAGLSGTLVFAWLLRQRITVENRALGRGSAPL
jgi:methyltransferase